MRGVPKKGKGKRFLYFQVIIMYIMKTIYEKAVELLNKGESIFAWAPSLREWLKDPDYVFWLGAGGLRIGR